MDAACAKRFPREDCSDLRPTPGVELGAMDRCFVDTARRRCGKFDKALAQCLLAGGPHVAGGCWHTLMGSAQDVVELDGQRYVCGGNWAACEKLAVPAAPAAGN